MSDEADIVVVDEKGEERPFGSANLENRDESKPLVCRDRMEYIHMIISGSP